MTSYSVPSVFADLAVILLAADLAGQLPSDSFADVIGPRAATTGTICHRLIHGAGRRRDLDTSADLRLPRAGTWETAWTALFDRVSDPPPTLAA